MSQALTYVQTGLYLGSRWQAANLTLLMSRGISAVINVTLDEPNHFEDVPGFAYLRIPIADEPGAPIGRHLSAALEFIGRMSAEYRGVLVHCRGGVSRSPAVIVAYLMSENQLTQAEALGRLGKLRRIDPQPSFLEQINEWFGSRC